MKLPEDEAYSTTGRTDPVYKWLAGYGWGDTLGHVDQQDRSPAKLCRDGGDVVGEVVVVVVYLFYIA